MTWETFLWNTLAVILTLSIFSFLYKDNPFYRFAEQLFVGVSAGYFTMLLIYTGLIPTLWNPLFNQHKWWYAIPGILGLMMWFRFSKNLSWISRYPIAFYIGIATGVAIPLEMQNRVSRQLADTLIRPEFHAGFSGFMGGISDILIIVGVLTGLFYFFFSVAHRGAFGLVAKTGIYILMIGFGASFGYTVMGRISLIIQRVQFIRNWIDMSQEGGSGMITVMYIVFLLVILLILMEIIRHLRKKSAEAV